MGEKIPEIIKKVEEDTLKKRGVRIHFNPFSERDVIYMETIRHSPIISWRDILMWK